MFIEGDVVTLLAADAFKIGVYGHILQHFQISWLFCRNLIMFRAFMFQ